MYEETAPPGPLAGVARCVWRSASAAPKRIVPDGCLDLVVGDGEVFIAGPDTAAWSSVTRPGAELRGVRFTPGRAPAVLGVAADELRDRRVPLDELWGHAGELLTERLLSGDVTPAQAVASRLAEVPPADQAVAALIARLDAGAARVSEAAAMVTAAGTLAAPERPEAEAATLARGADPDRIAAAIARGGLNPEQVAALLARGTDPAQVAAARLEEPVAVSERRLRRRFVQAVGYGPATYLRVARFQRAVALASRASGLAALAVAAGYADQAHLSRDCRALTGLTPRGYFGTASTVDSTHSDRLRSA
ncbi:Transcriptional regulator [Amycolatopsis camponoti]|uniref:Transcriptional regulator n=1 Tax=Amycolatopsis camponoti TaxID=2606593 RepID=A0A6I8LZU8_9PSEU|nr:helix-turn-helix domain-containing protein [Amycolatopsis camponoti]VVJ21175.1 Transcriptional regulator [Amycolatopsis camponoti]